MLQESQALYALALAAYLLAAATMAPLTGRRGAARGQRPVAWLFVAACALLAWRAVPPFWYALRISLYDLTDALLSAAAAVALLVLAVALRRAFS
jgi:hypothetical protein